MRLRLRLFALRSGVLSCLLTLALAACAEPAAPPALDAEAIHAELLAARGGTALRELATRLAAHGDAAVPVLVRWLDDPARNVRETAAHALGNLAPRTPEVVKALAARLEDPDDYVRWKVIRALGRQRGVAREYLPAIRAIAEATRETEVVRAAAERAVLEIQEGP
ncbi:MAG: HEAT repeat domain-containing protein [Planctomycetes bacterium]|nr:HEAT repeat domain-containing protein [Planctomycetota bacterium]